MLRRATVILLDEYNIIHMGNFLPFSFLGSGPGEVNDLWFHTGQFFQSDVSVPPPPTEAPNQASEQASETSN